MDFYVGFFMMDLAAFFAGLKIKGSCRSKQLPYFHFYFILFHIICSPTIYCALYGILSCNS